MCTWNVSTVDGTEDKKYPMIYIANQIKQHLAYLHSTCWGIWTAIHQMNKKLVLNKAESMEVFQS